MSKREELFDLKKLMSILLAALFCIAAVGCGGENAANKDKKEFTIVTSFYPMYIDVLNITKGVEGVKVVKKMTSAGGAKISSRRPAVCMIIS